MTSHPYTADPGVPADHRGDRPCVCGAAKSNARHDLPDVPAQAEHRRRVGEREDN